MSIETYLSLVLNEPKELIAKANSIREDTYKDIITYSRNIFVPVTRQCRNNCRYCGFANNDSKSWVTPKKYLKFLSKAQLQNCIEVLLTLGEKPEERYDSAKKFLAEYNFTSTVAYVANFAKQALEHHLLPHANLGILNQKELKLLKPLIASLGLMLENISNRLLRPKNVHYQSVGKNPKLRLKTIIRAGKLHIPFTTGLLVGIGETLEERIESLLAIEKIFQQYNHIQEVIIQNFEPQPHTLMADHPPPKKEEFLQTVALARVILSPHISIQIPPNLNSKNILDGIKHGANDLGGISPITPDFINPQHPWPKEQELMELVKKQGFLLQLRLPVYRNYVKYLSKDVKTIIENYYSEFLE